MTDYRTMLSVPVIMENCRVINAEIGSPMIDEQNRGNDFSASVKVQFTQIEIGEERKKGIRLSVSFDGNGTPYYKGNVEVRAKFSFPEGSESDFADEYLKTIGSSRAYDFARTFIESATSFGAYGCLELPPFDVSKISPMESTKE